jgi:hypothetical protein
MSGFYRTPAIPFMCSAISGVRCGGERNAGRLLQCNIETY